MLLRILYITSLLAAVNITVFGQELNFESFGRREGLNAQTITDFIEDDEGRLWIGTSGQGLVHFDGFRFEQVSGTENDTVHDVGFFNNTVYYLNSSGIYKASKYGVESHFKNENHAFEKFSMQGDSTWLVDKHGQLFISHKNTIHNVESAPVNDFFSFNNSLFLLTEIGIRASLGGWQMTFNVPDSIAVYTGASFDGSYYFASKQGVWAVGDTTFLIPGTENERIRSLCTDVRGKLWMAARNHVLTYNGLETASLSEINGLPSAKVRKLLTDRSGALWFGSSTAGLFMLRDMSIETFAQEHGFPETLITSSVKENDTTLWFGTVDGSVFRWNHADPPELIFQSSRLYLRNGVTDMLRCGNSIYFSLEKEGSLYYQDEKIAYVFENATRSIAGCSNYYFQFNGVVTPDQLVQYADLACENLNDLELYNDSLVIAAACGLYFLPINDNGTISLPENMSTFLPTFESESYHFTTVFNDGSGTLWLGTKNDGLLKYHNEIEVVARKSLSDQHVTGICKADDGNIWVSTTSGLSMIELTPEGDLVLNVTNYPLEYPVSPRTLQYFNGKLVFGSSKGLITFDSNGIFPDYNPPIVRIDDAFVNFEFPFNTNLKYNQNHLTFHFHAIDLADPFSVVYQCRLVGFENEFHEVSSPVVYPQLPPGDYTFEVRARNHDGIWSDQSAVITFRIDAPFYAKTGFIIFAVSTALLIIFLFIRWRVRALRQANRLLEEKVAERTKELKVERDRSERLLLNILPKETADELKQNGFAMTKSYRQASVLFSDFKGFTMMSELVSSEELVSMLDDAFKAFDRTCDQYGVEKIKTIGDAYMCATGLPLSTTDHAEKLVDYAFAMLKEMEIFNEKLAQRGLPPWQIRIGIHSGPLIAGVVGEKKFAYDIWGDTVNTASRMESSGAPNRINISATTYAIVKDKFRCSPRGFIAAKNKGDLEMYFVEERL
ncbi:MAG: hypothetical protein NWR73_06875 [Flavobacteriales bacterium]|jgi:class 3 adenylate cyclase|nr:hypothetical protein [Flavobacteriales bacterium]